MKKVRNRFSKVRQYCRAGLWAIYVRGPKSPWSIFSPIAYRIKSASMLSLLLILATHCSAKDPYTSASQAARPISLKQLQSHIQKANAKLIVLNHWATWCAPCKAELRQLSELQEKYGTQKLQIICVSIDSPTDPVKKALVDFIYQNHAPAIHGRYISSEDEVRSIMTAVDDEWLEVVPVTYLLDSKGVVVQRFIGSRSMRNLKEQLASRI